MIHAPCLMHGKTSPIFHEQQGCFAELNSPFTATRYHSLLVEKESLPEALEITAETEDGLIMGLKHKTHMIEGVQFHPESIETESGKTLLETFLSQTKEEAGQ